MEEVFKALSDETRLRIVALVLDNELCVCEIEACLGLTQSNASRHLTTLRKAGLLSSRKYAQWSYYRISEEFLENNRDLVQYLKEKLRKLPDYDIDKVKAVKCIEADLCRNKECSI